MYWKVQYISFFDPWKIISSLLKIERHHPQRDWGISREWVLPAFFYYSPLSIHELCIFFPSLLTHWKIKIDWTGNKKMNGLLDLFSFWFSRSKLTLISSRHLSKKLRKKSVPYLFCGCPVIWFSKWLFSFGELVVWTMITSKEIFGFCQVCCCHWNPLFSSFFEAE